MSSSENKPANPETFEVELKNPGFAALLAWLWPGAGHLYQGRTAKGVLYMVCILTTFFFGLWMGKGHVVYASWRMDPQTGESDRRLPYICQIGVGLPALPALVQAKLKQPGSPSPLGNWMAPPDLTPSVVYDEDGQPGPAMTELSRWHKEIGPFFELGTLFTMVAGLLNILAVYDAFAGPVFSKPEDKEKKRKPQRDPPDDDSAENDGKE